MLLAQEFAFEKTAKSILTVPGRKDLLKTTLAKKPYIRKMLRFSRKLDALANHSNSKWAKFGIPIAKSLAFISMSITGYSMGASLGEAINHNFDLDKPVKPNKKVAQSKLCYTA